MDDKEKYLNDDKEFQKFLKKNSDISLSTEDSKLAYYFKLSYLKEIGKLPKIGEDELKSIVDNYERVRELENAKIDYESGKISKKVYDNYKNKEKEFIIDKINEVLDEEVIDDEEEAVVTPLEVIKENKKKKKTVVVKKKLFMLASFSFVIAIIFLFVFFYLLAPRIELVAKQDFKLEYGTKWEEPGYKAEYFGKDITDKVYVEGTVNDQKLGKNIIKYNIRKNKIVITKKRVVTVVDTTEPVITLTGDSEVVVCPKKDYVEDGFLAEDTHDGDITKKVEVTTNKGEVEYSVKDESGNRTTVKRKLIREDKTAPELTLEGNETIYIVVNSGYKEPGFKAIDNCDDDITGKVVVEGEVNTGTVGTYTLKYSVTDEEGNIAEKERKVVVQQSYRRVGANYGCGGAGVIYLTFDDGPHPTYTNEILNVLSSYGVKATFFVLGQNANAYQSILKREVNEGHAIGIHTWSHEYNIVYQSSEVFWNEVERTRSLIKSVTGYDSKLIRFPGGVSNTVSRNYSSGIMTRLAAETLEKGYNYFDWNISSGDAGGTTDPSVECNNVTSRLSKSSGNVILMHDIKYHTMKAIECMVQYGKNNGYTFDVLNLNVNCKQNINN